MSMLHMLGVIDVVICLALFFMCFYRDRLNDPIVNKLMLAACAVFFFCWNYAAYQLGWLSDGFMTLENISPFTCTLILLTPFMSKRIKDLSYCAIACLCCGMFLALFFSPIAEFINHNKTSPSFIHISEAACHLIMAVYGFYLFLSGKVKVSLKTVGKAALLIYSVVFFGVFLNWYFHTSNFGMNMHGKYSIYWLDIFGSFEATLIAYLVGILGTLVLGYLTGVFLEWVCRPKASKVNTAATGETLNVTDADSSAEAQMLQDSVHETV